MKNSLTKLKVSVRFIVSQGEGDLTLLGVGGSVYPFRGHQSPETIDRFISAWFKCKVKAEDLVAIAIDEKDLKNENYQTISEYTVTYDHITIQ
ncbi:hypothetical protein KAR91_83810 [Candidatus Pacearchaeota archaeon]|nr:hypothetical protein [Candidatus Pacearchaeota archaeon]